MAGLLRVLRAANPLRGNESDSPVKMTQALDGFEMWAKAGHYSPLTLAPYRSALLKLAGFLGDPEIDQVSEADLLGFMAYLRSPDYQPSHTDEPGRLTEASMHRYWKAIRAFWKWAGEKLRTGRPDLVLAIPAYDSKEIEPYSREEVGRMLRACDTSGVVEKRGKKSYAMKRPTATRDRAILRLLLDTGIRVGELCRLRVMDLDFDSGTLAVLPHRKGKTRARIIPVGDSARQEAWLYLAGRGKTGERAPLFTVERERPISRARVGGIVSYLGERAGVPRAGPHRFRHTFAIEYLRGGGDVFTLQYILGHANMDMVRRYLRIANMDIEIAHHRSSPGDRWGI